MPGASARQKRPYSAPAKRAQLTADRMACASVRRVTLCERPCSCRSTSSTAPSSCAQQRSTLRAELRRIHAARRSSAALSAVVRRITASRVPSPCAVRVLHALPGASGAAAPRQSWQSKAACAPPRFRRGHPAAPGPPRMPLLLPVPHWFCRSCIPDSCARCESAACVTLEDARLACDRSTAIFAIPKRVLDRALARMSWQDAIGYATRRPLTNTHRFRGSGLCCQASSSSARGMVKVGPPIPLQAKISGRSWRRAHHKR